MFRGRRHHGVLQFLDFISDRLRSCALRYFGTVLEATKIAIDFLETYIRNGDLGVKAGKGFYCYPDPEYKKSDFLNPVRNCSSLKP
jgi:3-hydroxyacyl-CoA dehydrogenase